MAAERLHAFRAWRASVSRRTTYVFFEILTTTGRTGIGEATMSGDDDAVVEIARTLFAQTLSGCALDELGVALDRLSAAVGRNPALTPATAASALEQCVWDLRGKEIGVPVYELLGGRRRTSIALYANINRGIEDRTPEGFASAAKGAVTCGFEALKCAPFDGVRPGHTARDAAVRTALDRLVAVREAAPHARLMVDCHGRLSIATAQDIVPALKALDLFWLEEPLITHPYMNSVITSADQNHSDDYIEPTPADQFGMLGDCGIMLAGGEFEYGVDRFESLLSRLPLAVVMPDVKHCGGIWQATLVGSFAATRGVRLAPHNPSGPVATVASMHVCAAASDFEVLEYQWGEVPHRATYVLPREPVDDGTLRCSSQPGLGISLNHEALHEVTG